MSRSTTSGRVTVITYDYDMLSLISLALGARLIRISLTGLFVRQGCVFKHDRRRSSNQRHVVLWARMVIAASSEAAVADDKGRGRAV